MPSLTKEQRDRELSPLLRKGVEFMPLWACQRHGVDGPALLPDSKLGLQPVDVGFRGGTYLSIYWDLSLSIYKASWGSS